MENFEILKQIILQKKINDVRENIDWEKFIIFLDDEKLTLLFYNDIIKIVPLINLSQLQQSYFRYFKNTKKQLEYSKKILEMMAQNEFVYMKGFCLSQFIYGDYCKRVSYDIDIFCDEKNIVNICKTMDNYGLVEKYVGKFDNMSETEKNIYYLGNIEKKYSYDNIEIEIKTTANGITNHDMNRMIKNKKYMIINDSKFPVLDREDMFFRFVDNIGENTNINRAIFFGWKIRDVIDFYYCIKNNYDEIIQYNFDSINKRIYCRLRKMLYFTYYLIDKDLVLKFCKEIGINIEDLKFHENNIDLNLFELQRLFLDQKYLKSSFIRLRKDFILKREKPTFDGMHVNKHIIKNNEIEWFSKVPWMHPVIVNKYKISSSIGICYDKDFIYCNICISPVNLTYLIRLRFMNTNRECDKFYYELKFIVIDNDIKVFNKDDYFSSKDFKLYINSEFGQHYLNLGIRKKDNILIKDNHNNTIYSYMNYFAYICTQDSKDSIFFSKSIDYDDFEKIVMDGF